MNGARDIFRHNINALRAKYADIASRVARNNPVSIFAAQDNPATANSSLQENTAEVTARLSPFSVPDRNIVFIGVCCFLRFKSQADIAPPESFRLVVYEPNIDVFHRVLLEFDLSKEFGCTHMTFVVGSNTYFWGIKALKFKHAYEKELMYSVYAQCRAFFNYAWPLEVLSEDNSAGLFSRASSALKHLLRSIFGRLTHRNTLTPTRRFQVGCARFLRSLFLQLQFADESVSRGKNTRRLSTGKTKLILVLRTPRLWSWAELFARGFSQNGFDVEFVQIDNNGEYMRKAIHLAASHQPSILVTINRYAFEDSSAAFALEEALRGMGIPYVSFILDHLDYFYWEAEPLALDEYPKYVLFAYDRYFVENYSFGRKTFLLSSVFSYYANQKARGDFLYDICVTNRPREKNMRLFPEQEIIYENILRLPADPSIPISKRLYILLWKLVNKIDEEYEPNINRHVVLNAVRCFKMGFDSFFRRDVAKILCENFENVAFFGGKEWKQFVPAARYKGMVPYNEILEVYSRSRIVVDSFISWSDTAVHDFISLSQGGFTIFHKPAVCYNDKATGDFEYFSDFDDLAERVAHYLSNEEARLRRLHEIQTAIDKHFHFNDYFSRAATICNELLIRGRPFKETTDDLNEFGTRVGKCEISIFTEEIERSMVSFMASIAFYYAGYGRKAEKLIKEARSTGFAPPRDLDLFESKVQRSYYT